MRGDNKMEEEGSKCSQGKVRKKKQFETKGELASF